MSLPRLGVDLDSDHEEETNYLSKPKSSNHDEVDGGDGLSEFPTYEDYLDSQILPEDMKYLESEDLMRQLVELGYRGSGEALKRSERKARS